MYNIIGRFVLTEHLSIYKSLKSFINTFKPYLEVIFRQIFALLGYPDPPIDVAASAALTTAAGRRFRNRPRRLQRHGSRRGRRERPRRLLRRDDLERLAVKCRMLMEFVL